VVFPEGFSKKKAGADGPKKARQLAGRLNMIDINALKIPADAAVVADSWLMATIEHRKRQSYSEHALTT
jgi:hypothetical protein